MNPFKGNGQPSIASLPTEMLEKVFDMLVTRDQRVSSLVCHQWGSILSQDRFFANTVLSVRPTTLDSDWSLKRMKRPYRNMVISSQGLEQGDMWDQFVIRVRELIHSKPIMDNLRSLRVFMSVRAANEIFGQRGIIRLPKLQELTYSPSSVLPRGPARNETAVPVINVFAPALQTFKVDCLNDSCVELIRLLAPKIKCMVLRFFDKSKFLAAMSIPDLEKLRELSIHSMSSGMQMEKILSRDMGDTFRANLKRLDKLDIHDTINLFPYVYHLMFLSAYKLTYLNVVGVEMHPLALHAVNSISKLKVLQLMVSTSYAQWQSELHLHLPELEVLQLFPRLMARAGYLPKLKKFAIHNHTILDEQLEDHAIDALRTYCSLSTIKLLHFRDIVFTGDTLEAVSSFRSTPQIFLEDNWASIEVLHQIVNNFPGLKQLKLIRCRFLSTVDQTVVFVEDSSKSDEWITLRQAESVGQTVEFYTIEQPTELFPHCKVDTHESFFMEQIGTAPLRATCSCQHDTEDEQPESQE